MSIKPKKDMDIKDYIFKPGDVVITTDGIMGRITKVCDCEQCRTRGFNEPTWVEDDDNRAEHYITKFEAQNDFMGYYKVGNYRFNPFNISEVLSEMASYEKELERLKKQLDLMDDLSREELFEEDEEDEKDIRIRELEAEVEELRGTLEKAYAVIGQLVDKPNPFTED